MPGVRLKDCARGNGDGQHLRGPTEEVNERNYCNCSVCTGSRWLRMKVTRGQLAPAQESACRELIRAMGGEA